MIKHVFFVTLLLFNNLVFHGYSQSPASLSLSSSSFGSVTTFRAPSEYGISWQRLLLQLSSTYFTVVKENQVDLDSSLLYTSHSLGLSRLPVISEGFDDDDLLKKSDWVNKRDPSAALRLLPGLSGTTHLRLLVLLGAYYAFQPDAYHTYKDSSLFFLSQAREESKALHESKWGRQALCILGKVFVSGNALEQGATFFNQLTNECRADGDIKNEAKAWMYRGLYTAYSHGTTKDRISYLEKASDLYRRQQEPEGEINALMDIGYLWVSELQLEKGEAVFQHTLGLEDSIGFPYTNYTTDAITMATAFEGKYGEPLKYALQTMKTAEAFKDSIGWAYFYNRIGVLYGLSGNRTAESLYWLEKSLDRFILIGGDPSLYRNLSNIVILKIGDGRAAEAIAQAQRVVKRAPPLGPIDRRDYHLLLGDCYLSLKNYNRAEKNYLEAAQLEKEAESMRGNFNRAYITSRLASFYFTAGQYAKAKAYFRRFFSDPTYVTVPLSTTTQVQRMLSTIDSASGQYISALRHYQQYHHLIDSNFNISKQRQVEELGIQYETEKKENEIRIRDQHIQSLVQEDLLRQSSLRQADLVKNITIVGIGVLLIIGGLFYRQYRQKQKVNQIITQKNELITRKNELLERLLIDKDWLLKEVHHRVKNNLHTVICLLESQAVYLENDALKAIESSQHRIYAMSLIHQKLYQSEDIKMIDMATYLPEFIRYLRDSFGGLPNIRIYLNIESIKLSVSQAVPLGLIVNEAVTNSIKHAFPDNRAGEIGIELHQVDRQIKLSMTDNGIGIDPFMKTIELKSLGIELMKGLSRKMKGEIIFETDKGSLITVVFYTDPLNESRINEIPSMEKEAAI